MALDADAASRLHLWLGQGRQIRVQVPAAPFTSGREYGGRLLQALDVVQHDLRPTRHRGNDVALEQARLQLTVRVRLLRDQAVLAGLGVGHVLHLGQVVDGLAVGQVRLEDRAHRHGVLGGMRQPLLARRL